MQQGWNDSDDDDEHFQTQMGPQTSTEPDYNASQPSSLLVPGLLRGEPVGVDPTSITPLDDSGRGLFAAKTVSEEVGAFLSGGRPGWVAVKSVEEGRTRIPRNVRREATLLGKLMHENVLPLLNAYLLPPPSPIRSGMFLLFTPLYHLPLPSLLSATSFTPENLQDSYTATTHTLAHQMLRAVAYLHSQGVAHRDVGPSNFVLSLEGTGKVVLIDFGISIERNDEPPGKMYCEVGTGACRAPELLFTSREYDPFAVDIWALGVTISNLFRAFVEPDPVSDCGSDDDSEDRHHGGGHNGRGDLLEEFFGPSTEKKEEIQLVRKPLFDGSKSDFALIGSIFKVLGTPTIESWPEGQLLPDFSRITFNDFPPTPLASHLPYLPPDSPILIFIENSLKISAISRTPLSEGGGKSWEDWGRSQSAEGSATRSISEVVKDIMGNES
ncbi:kinase-like protein [Meredithblackwellia eburnea MCA 4105]